MPGFLAWKASMTFWVAAALSLLPHQPKRSSTAPPSEPPDEPPPHAETASRTPVRQSAAKPLVLLGMAFSFSWYVVTLGG